MDRLRQSNSSFRRIRTAIRHKLSTNMVGKEPPLPPAPPGGQASPESNYHHVSVDSNTSATNSEQAELDSPENSYRSVYGDTPMSNIDERHHYTSMPYPYSSSYTPYPYTFSQIPYASITLQETIRRRTQCLLHLQQRNIPDPFGEWASLASGTYGGTIPPEFYLSSAPFALRSLRGRARLRFICKAFCMCVNTTRISHIQAFLSRNPFIIKYLSANIVPNPELVFDRRYGVHVENYSSRVYNWDLLCAISELVWTDWVVYEAVRLSMTGKVSLSTLRKARPLKILPNVHQKMLERDSQPEDLDWLHKKVVTRMRENRPNSLLRHVVMPEEVVE